MSFTLGIIVEENTKKTSNFYHCDPVTDRLTDTYPTMGWSKPQTITKSDVPLTIKQKGYSLFDHIKIVPSNT